MVLPTPDFFTPLPSRTVYVGPFVHCKTLTELDICVAGAIGVDEAGVIAFVERGVDSVEALLAKYARAEGDGRWTEARVVRIKDDGFFFPGFIDTHIHAPQYPNAGLFGNSTLLDWLETYTWPLESSFADLDRARRLYARVVSRTLAHGTTTAAYFGTAHLPATDLLTELCLSRGQRALVGRVCMDSLAPDGYRDPSAAAALALTREHVAHTRALDPAGAIVQPIVTPRFAPSCTAALLAGLGDLAAAHNLPVQTHLSENAAEIALVRSLFPDAPSYTAVYDAHHLLTPRTVLAHCVHLSPAERDLVAARGSGVAHCPASNTFLGSGACHVRALLDHGIPVGLGTDVSGGYHPSVLDAVRHAVGVSRTVALASGRDPDKLATPEALYLATRGGARVLGLHARLGGFDVGLDWDAQWVRLREVPDADADTDADADADDLARDPVDIFGWESAPDRVMKWVYNGDDRNTVAVWVKGRLVHRTARFEPLE